MPFEPYVITEYFSFYGKNLRDCKHKTQSEAQ